MRFWTSSLLLVLSLTAARATGLAAQEWRSLSDDGKADARVKFAPMPPGWHVTTGPAANIVNPRVTAPAGPFAVEIESFLFPGSSVGTYGIILGGENLANPKGSYTAFLVRRDGSAAIVRRRGGLDASLLPWTRADSLPAPAGQDPVRAVLQVAVDPDSIRFQINGGVVGAVARNEAPADGALGLRVGDDVSVHITRLDVIQRYAPPRAAAATR